MKKNVILSTVAATVIAGFLMAGCNSTEPQQKDKGYESVGHVNVVAGENEKDDELIAEFMQGNCKENVFDLYPNEYLVIKNGDRINIYKRKGNEIVSVRQGATDGINPKNIEQACALDLLYDDDIPIKVIVGLAGSGKTFLGTNYVFSKVLNNKVNKHNVDSKVLVLRNPSPVDSVREIGFLKGTKEEKMESFFKPIVDNLADGNAGGYLEQYMYDGLVEFDSISFIKGRSLGGSDVEYRILVDEAEDLVAKTVKLIGTRLGERSKVVFVGDYQQAERDYLDQNGLMQLVDSGKNSNLVGYVRLNKDVRSEASKWFAEEY